MNHSSLSSGRTNLGGDKARSSGPARAGVLNYATRAILVVKGFPPWAWYIVLICYFPVHMAISVVGIFVTFLIYDGPRPQSVMERVVLFVAGLPQIPSCLIPQSFWERIPVAGLSLLFLQMVSNSFFWALVIAVLGARWSRWSNKRTSALTARKTLADVAPDCGDSLVG